jgi:hypothetical protein
MAMSNDLLSIRRKAATDLFWVLYRRFSGGTEGNYEILVRIVGIPSEIRTGFLRNKNQTLYLLSQFAW